MNLIQKLLVAAVLLPVFGVLPPATAHGQTNALFFPATGHHLTDERGFLGFWQAHDGARTLGYPVSELFFTDAGAPLQYFERGRLEETVDANGTAIVQTGAVGSEYAEAMWRTFAAAPAGRSASQLVNGHTLNGGFARFWEANGGAAFFGQPISEPQWEMTEQGQRRVQYFERARLERDPNAINTPNEIVVSPLGRILAELRQVDTAPRANWGATVYGPAARQAPNVASLDTPAPTPVPAAPASTAQAQPAKPAAPVKPATAPAKPAKPAAAQSGPIRTSGKLIVVNLSKQWLYAYQDGEQVFDAPVSTGRDGMNTPTGTFSVYSKLKKQTMDGVTDGEYWVVPDVPNVMYIYGGVALHGTYWHNRFGTGARLSHGCINLPLKSAAWLYDWSPIGTTVKVVA